jgi:hypothetical protein
VCLKCAVDVLFFGQRNIVGQCPPDTDSQLLADIASVTTMQLDRAAAIYRGCSSTPTREPVVPSVRIQHTSAALLDRGAYPCARSALLTCRARSISYRTRTNRHQRWPQASRTTATDWCRSTRAAARQHQVDAPAAGLTHDGDRLVPECQSGGATASGRCTSARRERGSYTRIFRGEAELPTCPTG